jgi:protein-S-isoprenylcysteine O-methyltransferase Ste14
MIATPRRRPVGIPLPLQSTRPVPTIHRKSRIERYRSLVNVLLYSLVFASCLLGGYPKGWRLSYRLLEILGFIVVVLGVLGRVWCGMYVWGRKSRELCKAGPYSVCRNPLYIFSFATGMGIAAQCHSIAVMAAFASIFWGYYYLVIKEEEKGLASLFGSEYLDYCKAVPRLVPQLRRYHTPEMILVPFRAFFPVMVKSAWPVLLAAAAELIGVLKANGALSFYQ